MFLNAVGVVECQYTAVGGLVEEIQVWILEPLTLIVQVVCALGEVERYVPLQRILTTVYRLEVRQSSSCGRDRGRIGGRSSRTGIFFWTGTGPKCKHAAVGGLVKEVKLRILEPLRKMMGVVCAFREVNRRYVPLAPFRLNRGSIRSRILGHSSRRGGENRDSRAHPVVVAYVLDWTGFVVERSFAATDRVVKEEQPLIRQENLRVIQAIAAPGRSKRVRSIGNAFEKEYAIANPHGKVRRDVISGLEAAFGISHEHRIGRYRRAVSSCRAACSPHNRLWCGRPRQSRLDSNRRRSRTGQAEILHVTVFPPLEEKLLAAVA